MTGNPTDRDAARPYTVRRREPILDTGEVRVTQFTLDAGQCVPWHHHTVISDTFVCIEGPMQVLTSEPPDKRVLAAGERTTVGPGVPHRVSGLDDAACRFVIVQGVGRYDYIPSPEPE
tara:strand:- start:1109 stop:1462 length:354 start_codon:yes stop_codon:yes gene_type:complete